MSMPTLHLLAALLLAAAAVPWKGGAAMTEFLDPGRVHDGVLTLSQDQWRVLEPKSRDLFAVAGYGGSRAGRDDGDFATAHADFQMDGSAFADVAVRYKGHGTFRQSRATLKRPFKLDLNQFVRSNRLGGVSKVRLNNNVADPSFMNEVVAYDLYREAGVPAPRTAHARISVVVPGLFERRFLGLYTLVENPDGDWSEGWFGAKKVMILKPTSEALFVHRGSDWSRYREAYDPKTSVLESQASRVVGLSRLVSEADDTVFSRELPLYVDVDEFARFMAVTVGTSSLDSILGRGGNLLVCLDPATRRFVFAPWDLDQAFGGVGGLGTQEQRERLSIEHPWVGTNLFLERVFKVDDFRTAYRGHLRRFATVALDPERIQGRIEEIADRIRPAVAEEGPVALRRFDAVRKGIAVAPVGPNGELPDADVESRPTHPKPILSFAAARRASILSQLEGRDVGLRIETGSVSDADAVRRNAVFAALAAALDADRDGAVTRAEVSRSAERWFGEWAGSPGGVLRLESLLTGIGRLDGRPGAARDEVVAAVALEVLSRFDTDRSGAVSRGEFAGGWTGWYLLWDTTNSGRLRVGELARCLGELVREDP
jgi:spore coat protein H